MSNLGGNSPSADTDKSNNLVGPPGADSTVPGPEGPASTVPGPEGPVSTVPGPEGPASTVPGPAGDDGVVQTIVGGTNTTIDATDPANPIVNVTVPSSSPTTTKGDVIARGASADERVAIGTNDQVLTADSAASGGVAWKDASGGGAGLAYFRTNDNPQAFSGSAFAAKGAAYACIKNVNITHVTAFFATNVSATYKLVIAEVSGGTDVIDAITGTSPTSAVNTTTKDTQHTFVFSSPVPLVSGKNYSFIFVRTDATTTAVNPVAFPSGAVNSSGELTYIGSSRYASIDPQVSDATRFDTSSVVQCEIFFETGASTTEVASAIDISGFISGLIDDAEIVLVQQVSRAFTLPSGLSGSTAYAQTAAAANATLDIQKNGSSIGTIDFALGVKAATFTFTSGVTFAVGDRLLFIGQGTSDVSLQHISLTLVGDLI